LRWPSFRSSAFGLRDALNNARRPGREVHALSIGHDLIYTSNSTNLIGVNSEFRTDLANILATATWRMIDRSQSGDPYESVRLTLTNAQRQALCMLLQREGAYDSFRLLHYRFINPNSIANTNPTVSP
jgi:hypothetical protein